MPIEDESAHQGARRHELSLTYSAMAAPTPYPTGWRSALHPFSTGSARYVVSHRTLLHRTTLNELQSRYAGPHLGVLWVNARTRSQRLFLMGRAFSLGVTLAAPAVVMSAILGWTLPVTVLVICVPMIVYTTHRRRAGRGVDRRQADVHHRLRACRRRSASCCYGIPQRRRLRPGAAPGRRDRPAAGRRLHVRPAARPTRSGRA